MAGSQWQSMTLPPRLPLVVATSNRDGSVEKDARLVNCFMETDQESNDIFVIKRFGLASAGVIADGDAGQGVYNWNGDIYSIFGGVLYKNGSSVGTGLDTSGGVYHFSSILGATPKLAFNNGIAGYGYEDIGGVTGPLHGVDSDYPEVTVKGWTYLNGPLYVMQPEAVIWGSEINAFTADGDWDPLNFIRAQIEPDNGVCLAKQLVYSVAFKQWTTEFFFDAGNAVGSPLGPVEGAKLGYGCASADSVQSIDDTLFFLTTNRTSSPQVGMIEALRFRIISTKPIDKLLKGADFSNVMSWQIKISGHSFYVLTIVALNLTLAYDIVEGRWCQWTDKDGNYMPIIASTYDSSGRHILQHATSGRLFYADTDYYMDNNDPIQCDIYTPNFDAGTKRRKMCSALEVVADQYSGNYIDCRRSDDDYQTWSNFRRIDLTQKNPVIRNEGTFSRRAYNFRHKLNAPMRLKAVELQYDVGVL